MSFATIYFWFWRSFWKKPARNTSLPHLRQGNKRPRPVRQQLLAPAKRGEFRVFQIWHAQNARVLIHNFGNQFTDLWDNNNLLIKYFFGIDVQFTDSGKKQTEIIFEGVFLPTSGLWNRHGAHQSVAKIVVGSDGIGLWAATKCLPRLRFKKK